MTEPAANEAAPTPDPTEADGRTNNKVAGNMQNSVQTGMVDTINYYGAHAKASLFARQVNDAELRQIRKQFRAPENFDSAEHVLTTKKAVVLIGPGSGRTFAGLRLLADQACTRLVHLSPERQMGDVDDDELRPGDGYLWDLSEQGTQPFKGWQINRVRQQVMRTHDCRLVIVLNDRTQVAPQADDLCVELKPPNAVTLAASAIDREWSGDGVESAQRILADVFAELLHMGASPEQAQFAADLAIRVARGELTVEDGRKEFDAGFDREVANIMSDSWETIEYTLMFAVALLQDEPFDEVVEQARSLDDSVRQKQLKEGKKLRPRQAFVKPNDELIRMVRARTDMRDNPSHPGLTVETVHFARRGWAAAVLCRIWQHYHVDRDLLLEWMCGPDMSRRHFSASVWALYTLITQVPAGDRLRELHRLAARRGFDSRRLAAATLARLDDTAGFEQLVQQALAEWVDGEVIYHKCAALVFYEYRFEQSGEQAVLDNIAEIARQPAASIRGTAAGVVLRLMTSQDRFEPVLRSVVGWVADEKSARRKDGLRPVAQLIGMYLLRMIEIDRRIKLELDPADVADRYPHECQRLVVQIMDDRLYGREVLNYLSDLTVWHDLVAVDETARQHATELVRITRLLAPGLRWWERRRTVSRLRRRYPTRRTDIRHVFRIARKAERTGLCGGVPVSPVRP